MTLFAALLSAIAVLPSDRMAMADRLFNRGEYVEARSEYAALEGEKSIPADELLYRLAECERSLGRNAEARARYTQLLDRHPSSRHADRSRLMRALAGSSAERLSELKVLDSDRVSPDIRAAALYFLGSAANDPAILERSIKLDPKGRYAAYANFHRASILVKSADAAERRKAVSLLLQIAFGSDKTFSDDALYLAAVQSYKEKKYGEAGAIFRRYLGMFPEGRHAADVRKMSAWSEYLSGKFADAMSLCGEGGTDDFAYLRAACAYALGDTANAERLFKEYLERFPQGKYRVNAELPLSRMKFDAAEKKGDALAVVENARRAYALSALSGDSLRLAWALEKFGRTAEAEVQYVETAKKFKDTDDAAEALFRKAMIHARAGNWSACELALSEAIASGKNLKRLAESEYWRGVAAIRLGHEAEGVKLLKSALERGIGLDEAREARLMLADADHRAGRVEEAKAAYSRLVKEGACVRMSASKILAVGKMLEGEDARTCAFELLKSDSPEWRQAGYVLLGATEERDKSYVAAIDAYRKAMAEKATVSDLAPAALALGRLESAEGNHSDAEAVLRRAVELNSADPAARGAAYLALAQNAAAAGDHRNARAYATIVKSLFSDAALCAEADKLLKKLPEDGE